jgi:hypothetical protein
VAAWPTVLRLAHRRHRLARAAALALLVAGLVPASASAADPQMNAVARLAGHTRDGAWLAIDVHLENDGPPIVGELEMVGGLNGLTTYHVPVDLPTQSSKTYTIYATAPSAHGDLEVALVVDGATPLEATVRPTYHNQEQLVIGVVAEVPDRLVAPLRDLPQTQGALPAVLDLAVADLPEHAAAWTALDRLVWQDADSTLLTPAQVDALTAWLAQGGRLVIVGGTSGPAILGGFPDTILPFRPDATLDIAPEVLAGYLGDLPDDAAIVPALSGPAGEGAVLVRSGDRVVAAERPYGTGSVTLVGVDPTARWIADSGTGDGLWRRLVPPTRGSSFVLADDARLVEASSRLPSIALPRGGGPRRLATWWRGPSTNASPR